MYTWIGLLVFIYSFISSIFFLSNSKTLNFLSHFLWGLQSWNLIYTWGQRVDLLCTPYTSSQNILYFSSFFCLSNWQRLKTCTYKIVSTYLWWLLRGVCELCSLSAIFWIVIPSSRYKLVTKYTWPNFRGSDYDGVKVIIKEMGFENDVKYGKSRIFIRSPQTLFALEEARDKFIPRLVMFLQRVGL